MVWLFPIPLILVGYTSNSMSFQDIDITKYCQVPIKFNENVDEFGRQHHCGAYGSKRRYDRHKGVDLYCPEGTPVYAVEDSIVVELRPFTGVKCGTDEYWNDTDALSAVGESGLVVYGEIEISPNLKVGDDLKKGDLIGHVKTVLKVNKNRPMSMLHLELHKHAIKHTTNHWNGIDDVGLLDPTFLLGESCQNNHIDWSKI